MGKMAKRDKKRLLAALMVVAAVLRLVWLSFGDTTTDEVLYAFRAAELVDYDESADQPTPLEWFDGNIPWWTSLSFHDHPPLVFWIQHVSMRIFGETNFGFRVPSALFGIAAVYLVYCIGRRLYNEWVGFFSALALAVSTNHVYISRSGMQESQTIFFILLSLFLFLRSRDDERYLIPTGAALGLSFLTKYTTFFLVPAFLLYLIFFKRSYFRSWKLYAGVGLSIIIFSPVILYNYLLYRAVGHFDFQFSFIFRQFPEVWRIAPGKEIGSLSDRIQSLVPNLFKINSWLFLGLFGAALLWMFARLKKLKEHVVPFGMLVFVLLLIFQIGTSFRFLSMFTPFFALVIGFAIAKLFETSKKWALVLVAVFVPLEIAYATHSQIWYISEGIPPWTHSRYLRYEKHDGGYNELGDYLASELSGKRPAQVFEMQYQFLNDLHKKAFDEAQGKNLEPYSAVIIYDDNVDHIAQLWVLDRLNIYHAWPTLKTEQYIKFLQANNLEDITDAGFDHYYVIIPTDEVFLRKLESRTQYGALFEQELQREGVVPISIKNSRGKEAFRVYKF